MTERGSSSNLDQTGIAFINMNLPREDLQYLSFEMVKTLFHEFGHAINIAVSNTKYQYLSGSRGTLDLVEIPSHFTELYLNEYGFVN